MLYAHLQKWSCEVYIHRGQLEAVLESREKEGEEMKNQYFRDIRDLFKYDLLTELIDNISALDQFILIPMLIEDGGKGIDGMYFPYSCTSSWGLDT